MFIRLRHKEDVNLSGRKRKEGGVGRGAVIKRGYENAGSVMEDISLSQR